VADLDGEIDQHQGVANVSTPWIKASRSDEQGSCVEQRCHDGMIEVRDSKSAPARSYGSPAPSTRRGSMVHAQVSSIICFNSTDREDPEHRLFLGSAANP
jgi:hypothetical protein